MQALYAVASKRIRLTTQAEQRAAYLEQHGLKPFDSLHVALAETSGADVFLTTDDHLIRAANKIDLQIKVEHPVFWIMEVMDI